jgi:predicted N-acetyltransferase YhbS
MGKRCVFMMIKIKYLADHPEITHQISTWYFDEWGKNNPALTIEIIEAAVQQRMNRDKLPLCLVAFLDNEPVGAVALKIREMETHPQYEHWLGNVYVLLEKRKQGIGSHLIEDAVREAKRIGISELYLYTRDMVSIYNRLGWETIEQVVYRGRKATIMRYELVK